MEDDVTGLDVARWLVIILMAGLVIGGIVLIWITILGPAFNQTNYDLFNNSPQHLNAVAQKFSDNCLQLSESKDATSRKAIEQDIYQVASTVDLTKVQMPDSTRVCVNKAISDVMNSH